MSYLDRYKRKWYSDFIEKRIKHDNIENDNIDIFILDIVSLIFNVHIKNEKIQTKQIIEIIEKIFKYVSPLNVFIIYPCQTYTTCFYKKLLECYVFQNKNILKYREFTIEMEIILDFIEDKYSKNENYYIFKNKICFDNSIIYQIIIEYNMLKKYEIFVYCNSPDFYIFPFFNNIQYCLITDYSFIKEDNTKYVTSKSIIEVYENIGNFKIKDIDEELILEYVLLFSLFGNTIYPELIQFSVLHNNEKIFILGSFLATLTLLQEKNYKIFKKDENGYIIGKTKCFDIFIYLGITKYEGKDISLTEQSIFSKIYYGSISKNINKSMLKEKYKIYGINVDKIKHKSDQEITISEENDKCILSLYLLSSCNYYYKGSFENINRNIIYESPISVIEHCFDNITFDNINVYDLNKNDYRYDQYLLYTSSMNILNIISKKYEFFDIISIIQSDILYYLYYPNIVEAINDYNYDKLNYYNFNYIPSSRSYMIVNYLVYIHMPK
uniref:XRN 5'-3' exonuclease n=1 Tax=Pithovirus LCDPAC02 TaxID=2506601 RepID=A0A481YQ28_9VIRU|nr:MAG: hypothetical protein LCDPAC02_02160 [Pithovirus LCDPAC02]